MAVARIPFPTGGKGFLVGLGDGDHPRGQPRRCQMATGGGPVLVAFAGGGPPPRSSWRRLCLPFNEQLRLLDNAIKEQPHVLADLDLKRLDFRAACPDLELLPSSVASSPRLPAVSVKGRSITASPGSWGRGLARRSTSFS